MSRFHGGEGATFTSFAMTPNVAHKKCYEVMSKDV